MFEFVNSTSDTLDQDEDVKRKVRSHAMKVYRARQRRDRRDRLSDDSAGSTRTTRKPGRLTVRFVIEEGHGSKDQDKEDDISHEQASTPLSVSPSTWGKETPDPFQSPAQLQQMFGLCREWFQWLRPDIRADFAGKPIDEAWEISPCPMLLAANCLAAVGGLDAADRSRPSGLEAVFKGRVLKEIQIRMMTPGAAATDETMSALLFLVSYEFYRLSPEAITHLKGLRSILHVKGQRKAGMRWGGGMVLETLDLLTALWQSTDPLITSVDDDEDDSISEPQTKLAGSIHGAFDACEAFKHIADILISEEPVESNIPSSMSTELLTAYLDSLSTSSSEQDPSRTDEFFTLLNKFSTTHCSCLPGAELQSHYIARVTHQTLAILYNVTTNSHPFTHASNQTYVSGIVQALVKIEEASWKGLPYLRYLALLTGASAAKSPCDKSFFHTHLGKCQMVLGIARWPEAKRFIVNFLRFRRGVEPKSTKPVRRRWKYLERLPAAGAQELPPRAKKKATDGVRVDGLIGYSSLQWRGEEADTMGLERLLTNDRTFHEAMLKGAFWRSE